MHGLVFVHMCLEVTKPVFRVSDMKLKLVCSARDRLEYGNFACNKAGYYTFQIENNKGADQSAQMRRLVCTFIVRTP